jgi:hypothetical protein
LGLLSLQGYLEACSAGYRFDAFLVLAWVAFTDPPEAFQDFDAAMPELTEIADPS